MSTGTALIEDALKENGVISVAVPSSPEQITDGMNKLNSMLQIWVTRNIFLGTVPITAPGQEVSEPEDTRNAIVFNLAIILANVYSVPVSADLRGNAAREFATVKRAYQDLSIPDKIASSTLPLGQGNAKGIDAKVFIKKGGTLSG